MDFTIISPLEFEQLCSDILSYFIQKNSRTFKSGRDGGIDIEIRNKYSFIMGQCKHYSSQNYNQLLATLKEEVKKVERNNPDFYYVFTSMELEPGQVNEIFSLFSSYMSDATCIFDGHRISEFLKTPEALPIVKNNIKLWIDSINTLKEVFKPNLSQDVDDLLNSIEQHKKKYVQTSFYFEAIDILKEKRILLITGKAGTGKSTVCEMALLHFLSEHHNARVIYSQIADYKELIRNISNDSAAVEIVYVDDFLGQSCIEIADKSLTPIKQLISLIERHSNKYLIINSRIQVLNEVQNNNTEIYERLMHVGLLDLGKRLLTFAEKAMILYSHIVSSKIGKKRIKCLIDDNKYYYIIGHKNYLPRIIQYLFNDNQYPTEASKYLEYIDETLNHPERVWQNEYDRKIFPEDRMLLEIIYSLSDYHVDREILEIAFNSQKGNPNYSNVDLTKSNLFRESLKRLNGGFLNLSMINEKEMVQVSDPSVNDFLKSLFANKSKEMILKIAERSVSFDQYCRLLGKDFYNSTFVKQLHLNGFTYRAKIVSEYLYNKSILYIASLIVDNSDALINKMISAIKYFIKVDQTTVDLSRSNALNQIIVDLVTDKAFAFYPCLRTESIFENVLNLIRYRCIYDDALDIYNNCTDLEEEKRQQIIYIAIREAVIDAYTDVDIGSLFNELDMDDYRDCYVDEEGMTEEVYVFLAIAEAIREKMVDHLDEHLESFSLLNEVNHVKKITRKDIEEVLDEYCDFEDIVKSHLDDRDYEPDDYSYYKDFDDGESDLKEMFEGLLDLD